MVYDNAKSFCWILSGNKLNLQAGNQKPMMGIKLYMNASFILYPNAELIAPTNIRKIVPGPRIVPTIIMI